MQESAHNGSLRRVVTAEVHAHVAAAPHKGNVRKFLRTGTVELLQKSVGRADSLGCEIVFEFSLIHNRLLVDAMIL